MEGRKRRRAAKVHTFNNTLKISRKLAVDSPEAHKEILKSKGGISRNLVKSYGRGENCGKCGICGKFPRKLRMFLESSGMHFCKKWGKFLRLGVWLGTPGKQKGNSPEIIWEFDGKQRGISENDRWQLMILFKVKQKTCTKLCKLLILSLTVNMNEDWNILSQKYCTYFPWKNQISSLIVKTSLEHMIARFTLVYING